MPLLAQTRVTKSCKSKPLQNKVFLKSQCNLESTSTAKNQIRTKMKWKTGCFKHSTKSKTKLTKRNNPKGPPGFWKIGLNNCRLKINLTTPLIWPLRRKQKGNNVTGKTSMKLTKTWNIIFIILMTSSRKIVFEI